MSQAHSPSTGVRTLLPQNAFSSGDRIRTCDLWVMSEPVAVSRDTPGLIPAGHPRSAVQAVSPGLACSHLLHHLLGSRFMRKAADKWLKRHRSAACQVDTSL